MSDGLNDRDTNDFRKQGTKENHNNNNNNRNKLPRDAWATINAASERKFGAGAGNRYVSNGREETTRSNRSSRGVCTTPPSRVWGGGGGSFVGSLSGVLS
jgi:hypothetical protein